MGIGDKMSRIVTGMGDKLSSIVTVAKKSAGLAVPALKDWTEAG